VAQRAVAQRAVDVTAAVWLVVYTGGTIAVSTAYVLRINVINVRYAALRSRLAYIVEMAWIKRRL
jgi:hypothetical protein